MEVHLVDRAEPLDEAVVGPLVGVRFVGDGHDR